MGNVWAKKPLKEVMRENKRMINRAIRELDRERQNLEKNEKKLIADIKKYVLVCVEGEGGKHGGMGLCRWLRASCTNGTGVWAGRGHRLPPLPLSHHNPREREFSWGHGRIFSSCFTGCLLSPR